MEKTYFLIFWLPTVASAVGLRIAWTTGELRRLPYSVGAFLIAFGLQLFAPRFSPGWVVGLVLQTLTAVYLGYQFKLYL